MNTRIKELAKLAQQYAEYTTPQGLEWFDAFKEKFAELIVKECFDVVIVDGRFHDAKNIINAAKAVIMEHFEVE